MIATDMTSCGSTEEKLRWAFKMYDEDGSGKYWNVQYQIIKMQLRKYWKEGAEGNLICIIWNSR